MGVLSADCGRYSGESLRQVQVGILPVMHISSQRSTIASVNIHAVVGWILAFHSLRDAVGQPFARLLMTCDCLQHYPSFFPK